MQKVNTLHALNYLARMYELWFTPITIIFYFSMLADLPKSQNIVFFNN